MRPSRSCTALLLLLGSVPSFGQSLAHRDAAPLPPEVIEKVTARHRQTQLHAPTELDRQLQESTRLLETFEDKNRLRAIAGSVSTADLNAEGMQLAGSRREFGAVREKVRRQMADLRSALARRGLGGISDLDTLKARVEERFARIDAAFAAVQKASTRAERADALRTARRVLEELNVNGARRAQDEALRPGPTFRQQQPSPPRKEPRSAASPAYIAQLTPEEAERFAWIGSVLAFIIPSANATPASVPTEAQSCGYGAADLADDGQEIRLTTEIRDLASDLGYSPARIFEYVANDVRFEPYFGSLKGAMGARYSGAGGATDQASLLIALLRASNIPARYVRGVIRVTDTQELGPQGRAARWIGAASAVGAATILAQHGNPTARVVAEGGSYGVELSHVWVEACVAYGNYRGSGRDFTGHRWIPLDPSFEDNEYLQFVRPNVSFDFATYMATRKNYMPHEAYEEQVMEARGVRSLEGIGYKSELRKQKFDVLPASLPYEVVSFTNWSNSGTPETAVIPDSHRNFFEILIQNGTGGALAPLLRLSMPEMVLKRVTLAFEGASQSDRNALSAWRNSTDPNAEIACSVNVIPTVRVDGVDRLVGTSSVGVCTENNRLQLTVSLLEARADPIVNQATFRTINGANFHALQAYAFQASDRLLSERAARLLASVKAASTPNANLEETEGEFLHLVGLKYMRYITDAIERAGRLAGASGDSGNHLGLTSSYSKVQYIFDLPFAVAGGGFLVDVPGGQARTTDLATGGLSTDSFAVGGYSSSAYESYIWQENARLDAVSSVRGIQFARETGIQMLTITAANAASQIPLLTSNSNSSLNYSPSAVSSVQSLAGSGYTVTLPRSQIQYENWRGTVWIAERADSAAFQIGGGYAGGYSVGSWLSSSYNPTFNSGYSYSSPPSYTPPVSPLVDSLAALTINSQQNLGYSNSSVFAGDPVNVVNGNFFHVEADVSVKGRGGLPIVFTRTYNSRDGQDGPLGFGWTHSFNHYLEFEDGNTDGATSAVDTDGLTSSVTWSDGSGSKKFIGVTGTASGVAIGSTFTTPQGSHFIVTRKPVGTYEIREKDGLTYVFQSMAGTAGQKTKLAAIMDRNGNTLTLTYVSNRLSSVTDALGRGLTFEYSGNRISAIVDVSARRYEYVYDARGDLTTFRNPLVVAGQQSPVTYEYYTSADGLHLNHAMRRFVLPRGNSMTFEYYANGRVFRHYNSLGETVSFTYNDFRRETVTVNERGFERRYFFNQHGNTIRVIDEGGAVQDYTFDPSNPFNRTEDRDVLNRRTQYTYDANGNVTRVTAPSGNYVEYSHFTPHNQPGKIRDANGNYTLLRYDAAGNLLERIALRAGVGASITPATYTPVPADILAWSVSTYDSYGHVLTTKRLRDFATGVGPSIQYTYDANGLNPASTKRCGDRNGDGAIADPGECDSALLTHDTAGQLRTGVDAAWYPVEYNYDALGRLTRGSDRLGKLRDYFYDANGNPSGEQLVVSEGGVPTKLDERALTFDQADRLSTSRDAGGFLTSYQYDTAGNVKKVTDPDGYSIGFDYDRSSRAVAAYDKEGHRATSRLDAAGRLLSLTDPNGTVAKRHEYYGAERDGRVRRVYDALNRFTEFDYDAAGNVALVTDNTGRTTRTEYDALGRPVRIAGPLLAALNQRPVTRYLYDNLGNRTRIEAGTTDSTGTNASSDSVTVQATYLYDDYGRKLRETDALNRSWNFTYDQHGNVQNVTDARGQLTQYTYEPGGLLKTRRDNDNNLTEYTYDALGLVAAVSSPVVGYTYRYDAAHRLTQVTDSRGPKSLFYRYSAGGLLNSMADSEGRRTDYLYDPAGRLSGIWTSSEDQVTFVYDEAGRLVEKRFSNGASTRYDYNIDGTLARLVNIVSASTISEHVYTYDQGGRRDTATDTINGGSTSYRYIFDELGRLTDIRNNPGGVSLESFTYDIYGNRRTRTTVAGTSAYLYDTAHQLQEIRQGSITGAIEASFDYDLNGNLTQKSVGSVLTSLVYDPLNRVRQVDRTGIPTQIYDYDSSNRRVRKLIGSTATNYVYNGGDIAAEYGASWSTAVAAYTAGARWDDAVLRTSDAGSSYYHRDGLNSVVAVSGATGAITGAARYDAWGNRVSGSGSLPRYGYTGREPDETGLIYYRARYYDPSIARFTQMDPAGFVDGINRYSYAVNNPVNFIDPSGLFISSPSNSQASGSYLGLGIGDVSFLSVGVSGGGNISLSSPALNTAAQWLGDGAQWLGNTWTNETQPIRQFGDNLEQAAIDFPIQTGVNDIVGTLGAAINHNNFDNTVMWGSMLTPLGEGLALARGGATVTAGGELVTVTHFTSAEGVAAIEAAGGLRAGTFVALPIEFSGMTSLQVEGALEIQAGRGAFSTTFQTPASNLITPFNGPFTSGFRTQFQLLEPVPLGPGSFVPAP